LFGLNDDVLSELRDAFNINPSAVAMIDALAETREIYLAWFEGRNYDNNSNRIQLMKRNLSAYYQEALR
jgi:hypothetical protein